MGYGIAHPTQPSTEDSPRHWRHCRIRALQYKYLSAQLLPFTPEWQKSCFHQYLEIHQSPTGNYSMLLTQNYHPPVPFQQQHQRHRQDRQHQAQPHTFLQSTPRGTDCFYDTVQQASPFTTTSDTDLDLEPDSSIQSASSSPVSAQSLLSQYSSIQAPLSGFDTFPTIAVPREVQQSALFDLSNDVPSLFANTDLMHSDSWMPTGQLTPRSAARFPGHHRESSLSSLGSAGPASPYSHNTSNPHVVAADSVGDSFHGLPSTDDFNYHLASKAFQSEDAFYANYPNYASYPARTTTGPDRCRWRVRSRVTHRLRHRGSLMHLRGGERMVSSLKSSTTTLATPTHLCMIMQPSTRYQNSTAP
jgi:hypothetical protein